VGRVDKFKIKNVFLYGTVPVPYSGKMYLHQSREQMYLGTVAMEIFLKNVKPNCQQKQATNHTKIFVRQT
jgi:hypothetical protein